MELSLLQFIETTYGGCVALVLAIVATVVVWAFAFDILSRWSHSFVTLKELEKANRVLRLVDQTAYAMLACIVATFYFRSELIAYFF